MSAVRLARLETRYGHTFYLPEGFIPYQEDAIREHGIYEPATSAAIYRFIKPGMHVIEGGACCGYHALNIAKATGPEGKVYCFEANPHLIGILRKNLEVNGYRDTSEVYQTGLWSCDSELSFPLLGRGLGGASFKSPRQLASFPTVPVKVVSLDSMFADKQVDFLRMDIEGAEIDVIKGASTILSGQRPTIIMEWIPGEGRAGEGAELFALLQEYGYRIYRITANGLAGIRHYDELNQQLASTDDRDILCRSE